MRISLAAACTVVVLAAALLAEEQGETTSKVDLSGRYVELAAEHASLLNHQELEQAVAALEKQHQELLARRTLEELSQSLEQLTEKHPETAAAQIAKQMLAAKNRERAVETFPGSRVFQRIGETGALHRGANSSNHSGNVVR